MTFYHFVPLFSLILQDIHFLLGKSRWWYGPTWGVWLPQRSWMMLHVSELLRKQWSCFLGSEPTKCQFRRYERTDWCWLSAAKDDMTGPLTWKPLESFKAESEPQHFVVFSSCGIWDLLYILYCSYESLRVHLDSCAYTVPPEGWRGG